MIDPADFAEQLEIFFGNASDAVAHAYARLPGAPAEAGWRLAGRLRGPKCRYAETLPAHFTFVDRGPGKSLLAEATVPEPCFWTPEMPHVYEAEVELRQADKVLATVRRPFAFRRLGATRRNLIFDSKRWVLRGVASDEVPAADLGQWREAGTAMLVHRPADELCREASLTGVLLVAQLDAPEATEIRRLARHPAVGMIVVPADAQQTAPFPGDLGHNLILAQRFRADQPVAPASWAQVALVEVGAIDSLTVGHGGIEAPVVALRLSGRHDSPAAGRAACDRLQRDLATLGDWAGYVV